MARIDDLLATVEASALAMIAQAKAAYARGDEAALFDIARGMRTQEQRQDELFKKNTSKNRLRSMAQWNALDAKSVHLRECHQTGGCHDCGSIADLCVAHIDLTHQEIVENGDTMRTRSERSRKAVLTDEERGVLRCKKHNNKAAPYNNKLESANYPPSRYGIISA